MYAPENTSEFFSSAVKRKWIDLVPSESFLIAAESVYIIIRQRAEGLGYLQVEHPEDYNNLPKPLEHYEGTVFTTCTYFGVSSTALRPKLFSKSVAEVSETSGTTMQLCGGPESR